VPTDRALAPEPRGLKVAGTATLDEELASRDSGTRKPFAAHVALSLIVLMVGAYAKTSDEVSDTGSAFAFPVLCTLVLSYALLQVLLVRRCQQAMWIISPAVQSALFLHFLPTAGALSLPFLPKEAEWAAGFDPFSDPWAVRYEWLNLVGAVALWTGYWSGAANAIGRALASSRTLGRVLRPGCSWR
jgi:hypothetical protein